MYKKKKKIMITSVVVLLFLFLIGVSYALWQITLIQEEKNIVTSACFEVTLEEENDILLNNAYPITESEGQSLTPYTFKITNVCSTTAMYQVNLEELQIDTKKLSSDYVSVSLNKSKGKILSSYEVVEKTLSNATTSHKLTTGTLREGESKTYELRLWMDYDTPPIDEVMESSFESKITIIAIHNDDLPEVLVEAREQEDGITVDISTVSNPKNEELVYFYRLNEEEEIESSENTHTFTGLSDGKYKAKGRAETTDGLILEEKELDVTVAYEKVYISSSGSDETGNGAIDNPYATLQPAYNKVKSGGEMILLSDITSTETTNMNIENKEVTLRSEGENICSIFRGNDSTRQILDIRNSNTVTTTNITFDGNNVNAMGPLLYASNSILFLKTNTTVQKGKNSSYGGGVYINNGSTLTVNQAIIQNNSSEKEGGGLCISTNSTLIFNSGSVTNNSSSTFGGGIYGYNSNITINNADISNNNAVYGGGVASTGNDVSHQLIMNNGSITNNSATQYGGGVYVLKGGTAIAIAYIKGGTIANNTAPTGPNTYADGGAQIIDER